MRRPRHSTTRALAVPLSVRQAPLTLLAVTGMALLLASVASVIVPAVLVQ